LLLVAVAVVMTSVQVQVQVVWYLALEQQLTLTQYM
jgi:hypothetical protein